MNRSLPPSSGVMNPYPFASLNHFTVPVAIKTPPLPFHERARKAHCLTELALFLIHASRFFDRLLAGFPRCGGRLLGLPLQRPLLLDPALALPLRHRRLSLAPHMPPRSGLRAYRARAGWRYAAACSSSSITSFFIPIIACMTRCDFSGSG